jgi:hypothetical protein
MGTTQGPGRGNRSDPTECAWSSACFAVIVLANLLDVVPAKAGTQYSQSTKLSRSRCGVLDARFRGHDGRTPPVTHQPIPQK